MSIEVEIKKNIIEWAISRAGYEIHEYLVKNPLVNDWLNESKKPTVKQLEKFSNNVNVPFGYMFLDSPPEEELEFPFFRTGKGVTNKVSLNVYDAVQLIERRQAWLTEYLINEGYDKLDFVGKFNKNSKAKEIVTDIRKTLNLNKNWASIHNTWERALDHLALVIEESGIIINFSGVVENNNKRTINVEECRGFVLVNEYAPFMFVNAADAKAAQMFTIIHELAHIWIGVSAGFDIKNMLPANDPVEKLCDEVAAEFLVPEDYFINVWKEEKDFKKINRIFKVSPIVVARRALDLNLIAKEDFFQFYNNYLKEIQDREDARGSGGNFYATTKKRISLRFATYINNAVKENKLLYRDAYRLTGLKGSTYAKFVNEYLFQA